MKQLSLKLAFAAAAIAAAATGCTKDPEHAFQRTNPLDPKGPVFEVLRTYGGSEEDHFYSISPTPDGGFLMAGTTYSASLGTGAPNLYVVRTDGSGNMLWESSYGGDQHEYDGTAITTSDGGCAILGNTRSFSYPYSDIYLVRTDWQGNAIWTRTYGRQYDDYAKCIRQTPDSGFVIAGFSSSTNTGWLLRTDEAGDTTWTKAFQGSGLEVELTDDGGYIVAAGVLGLFKFDNAGAFVWSHATDYAQTVEVLGDGYVAAYQNSVFKVGLNGELVWKRTLGGQGLGMTITPEGDVVVTGCAFDSAGSGNNVLLAKFDGLGNLKWSLAFPTVGIGRGICWGSDGSCAVAGNTKSWGGDGFFLKTKAHFEEGL